MDTDRTITHACGGRVWPVAPPVILLAVLAFAALVTTFGCGGSEIEAQERGGAGDQSAPTLVPAGRMREFSVTAYCTGTVTQSGARVKAGMAAADPRVLPVGSTVRVEGQGQSYDGIYTVTDTGRDIKGRELDLYIDDCAEAKEFGRRTMNVAVIRRGWDPAATPDRGAVAQ